jgi:hypothetical protein
VRWLAVSIALGLVLAGCGDRAAARELCGDLAHLGPTIAELGAPSAGTQIADLRAAVEKVATIIDDVDAMTDRLSRRVRDGFWVALTSYRARLEEVPDDQTVEGTADPRIGAAAEAMSAAAEAVRSALACGS